MKSTRESRNLRKEPSETSSPQTPRQAFLSSKMQIFAKRDWKMFRDDVPASWLVKSEKGVREVGLVNRHTLRSLNSFLFRYFRKLSYAYFLTFRELHSLSPSLSQADETLRSSLPKNGQTSGENRLICELFSTHHAPFFGSIFASRDE